jgi:hypothetical protein
MDIGKNYRIVRKTETTQIKMIGFSCSMFSGIEELEADEKTYNAFSIGDIVKLELVAGDT